MHRSLVSFSVAHPMVLAIEQMVFAYFGVRRGDLGRPRLRSTSIPRSVCMALLREYTQLPVSEIAKRYDRDRSMVAYAQRSLARREQRDAKLRRAVLAMRRALDIFTGREESGPTVAGARARADSACMVSGEIPERGARRRTGVAVWRGFEEALRPSVKHTCELGSNPGATTNDRGLR